MLTPLKPQREGGMRRRDEKEGERKSGRRRTANPYDTSFQPVLIGSFSF
jgi:hypothetical protein